MQVADDNTVLGDFSNTVFEYFEMRTTFFKKDGKFFVRSDDQHEQQRAFEVTHTFGIEPLQQYLVAFPSGRKQALPFAWDTRPPESGGQRWYHLYPNEYIAPDDPLHWTGRYFNWNYMCAECHSTDVDLGYDINTDSFRTTFSEVSVGCEACHGPGTPHIAQAQTGSFSPDYGLSVNLDDKNNASWTMNADTGMAERSTPVALQQQPESCGRCHSRRSTLTQAYEYGKPLSDTHMPSLLEENLYHADGRILDEVYVYGSFIQSKMYRAGVTCTDCHNPHSGNLVTGPEPSAVCFQCHLPARFATAEHSGSDSVICVDCHMLATTYMGVDDRRDHSFRIPGAGLVTSHYGNAIAAGRLGQSNNQLLKSLANPDHPAIARATMLTLLVPRAGDAEAAALTSALDDANPLVRIAAVRALRAWPAEFRSRYGSHLLRDPVRGVRVEAAGSYAEIRDLMPIKDIRAFASAADEYRAAMLAAASMPDAVTNLAEFESRTGNTEAAEKYFRHAIRINAKFGPARHAYGLFLVRTGRADEALEQLRGAASLVPDNPRYVYVLGVALNSLGQGNEALTVLTKARSDFPSDFDIAWALATMLRDSGNVDAALSLAREMGSEFPGEKNVAALVRSLKPE